MYIFKVNGQVRSKQKNAPRVFTFALYIVFCVNLTSLFHIQIQEVF